MWKVPLCLHSLSHHSKVYHRWMHYRNWIAALSTIDLSEICLLSNEAVFWLPYQACLHVVWPKAHVHRFFSHHFSSWCLWKCFLSHRGPLGTGPLEHHKSHWSKLAARLSEGTIFRSFNTSCYILLNHQYVFVRQPKNSLGLSVFPFFLSFCSNNTSTTTLANQ